MWDTCMNYVACFFPFCEICVGVQKERMVPEDMYVLSPDGFILSSPASKPYPYKPPKCTDCALLFMKVLLQLVIFGFSIFLAFTLYLCVFLQQFLFLFVGVQVYGMCKAGAVIHSHGMESCLVTMINPFLKEFRVIYWILLSDDFSPSIFLKKIHFLIIEDLTLAFSYFSSVINSCFYRTNIWLHAFYNLLTFSLCR